MNSDAIVEIVRNAVEAAPVPAPDIGADGTNGEEAMLAAKFEDLGFDSLAFMEFCIAIHVDTGVEMTVEQAAALGSPKAVIEFLGKAL